MKKYLLILVLLTLFIFPKPAFASEQTYYIHSDHLGSTAMVTDGEGNMVSEQNYYPYGNDRNQLPVTDYQLPVTERAYTSQISDIQTGLYYYNARYYSPKLAKFTQADSQMGPNRYLYTRNNPIKYVDSTGHQSNFSPIGYSIYSPETITFDPPDQQGLNNVTLTFSEGLFSASTSLLDYPVNAVDYRLAIDAIDFYQNGHVYTVNYKQEWSVNQRGMLAESLQKLPEQFLSNYTYLIRDNSINLQNAAFASTVCGNSNTCNISFRDIVFTNLDEYVFHEFVHVKVARSGSGSTNLLNISENRPKTEQTDLSLALIGFMNTVGYYSWDENKQVYTAPWEKCFRSGGASSCVGPHEEIAYMGQLYAMDSAEFRKKFGEDLYNFYYHFFDENTYYHYDS